MRALTDATPSEKPLVWQSGKGDAPAACRLSPCADADAAASATEGMTEGRRTATASGSRSGAEAGPVSCAVAAH